MKTLFLFLSLVFIPEVLISQWDKNTTPTYKELISIYQKWDAEHDEIQLFEMGESDADLPIYLCVINGGKDSLSTFKKAQNNTTILINNAIHPGEPDGVNACLLYIENWIKSGKPTINMPVLAIIPAYNIGGMLNRSSSSRANQEGPENYGFRGNNQNLDLNRDFIKMDSKNAETFVKIYQALDPDVFVDTHVSNGADYQYTFTLITSLRERLTNSMYNLTYKQFLPDMTKNMKKKSWDWAPYVETKGETPESGIVAFNDLPRYASGYGSLFHALSLTVETHMLKPFPQRVKATYDFIEYLVNYTSKNAKDIEKLKLASIQESLSKTYFKYNYSLVEKADSIQFKGFEYSYIPSEVTGLDRLKYDQTKPFTKNIPYYKTHRAKDSIEIPMYYFVQGSEVEIIERLKANGVQLYEVGNDFLSKEMKQLKITQYKSPNRPYEGHFPHNSTQSSEVNFTGQFLKGTVIISTGQKRRDFIISVLEPEYEDSYFTWNFMDSYVQQKEYFSPYVFEDKAAELLKNNPSLNKEFKEKQTTDLEFAKDEWSQLLWIYQRSPYFEEETFNRLPIFKVY